jgi:ArsR family transcriptional regulator
MARKEKRGISKEAVELLAARFKAMGEPLRLMILQELGESEKSVSDIAQAVGTTQPNVSKHLKLLLDTGLLARRQAGNIVYYSVADRAIFDICNMICDSLRARICEKADAIAMGEIGKTSRRK